MKFRFVHRILGAEPEIEDIHQGLKDRSGDGRAAGGAYDEEDLSFIEDQGGSHRAEHAFAGRDGIRLRADRAIHIGNTWFDAEIVHLVVEKETGAPDDDPGAISTVERSGDGDRIAFVIDDVEMGRLLGSW